MLLAIILHTKTVAVYHFIIILREVVWGGLESCLRFITISSLKPSERDYNQAKYNSKSSECGSLMKESSRENFFLGPFPPSSPFHVNSLLQLAEETEEEALRTKGANDVKLSQFFIPQNVFFLNFHNHARIICHE